MWSYDSHSKDLWRHSTTFKKLHWPVSDLETLYALEKTETANFRAQTANFPNQTANFGEQFFFGVCLQTNPKLNAWSSRLANLCTNNAPTPLFGMVGTVFIEIFWLSETRTTPKIFEIYLSWAFCPTFWSIWPSCFAHLWCHVLHVTMESQLRKCSERNNKLTQMRGLWSIGHVEQHVLPKFKYTFNSSTTLF